MGQSSSDATEVAKELSVGSQVQQNLATSSSSKATPATRSRKEPVSSLSGTALTTTNGFKPKEYAQEYLRKHVGSSPRSTYTRSFHSQILEERARAAMRMNCCSLPFISPCCGSDRGITNAVGKPQGTDLQSLLDVNGDGIECNEVMRAVCMVDPVFEDEVATREGVDYLDVDHGRDEEEVQVRVLPRTLEVPTVFKTIRYDWAAPSGSQALPTVMQQEALEKCMKPFIQSMLLGVLVRLRLEDVEAISDSAAKSINAMVSFDDTFAHLLITVGATERSVPIKAIRWVRPPDKGLDSDKCVDIRLAGGRFLRFLFNTQAQAKFFGTCMRLLVKATRSDLTVGVRVA